MDYFFYIPSARSLEKHENVSDPSEYLIENDVAITSGEDEYRVALSKIRPNDILLMYRPQIGIVAVGLVTGDRVTTEETATYVSRQGGQFNHDFHLPVKWRRIDTISIAAIRGHRLFTPRPTIQRITDHAAVERLLAEFVC